MVFKQWPEGRRRRTVTAIWGRAAEAEGRKDAKILRRKPGVFAEHGRAFAGSADYDYEQATEFPIVLGYKQGCSPIMCPFLFFSISCSEMCKKTCCPVVHWVHCGLRQDNQLKRRNSEKTLNDRALYLLGWEPIQIDWSWRTGQVEEIGELWSPSVNINARTLWGFGGSSQPGEHREGWQKVTCGSRSMMFNFLLDRDHVFTYWPLWQHWAP